MSKKCLLISPSEHGRIFPRGLMEIASFLQGKGYSIKVLPLAYYLGYFDNLDFTDRHSSVKSANLEKKVAMILERAIKRFKPAAIGISNQFTIDYPECIKILKICKKVNNRIITVIGGHHVTFQDEDCLKLPFVDVVVRGEGEWTMLDLLSAVDRGRDLESVKGITFRRNGKVLRTPERPLGDLNELPPIDFGLLPYEFVQKSVIRGILSRGCVYNCKFCSEKVFWRRQRSFSTQRLIKELKTLKRVYKTTILGIEDSMLRMGSRHFFELCSELVKHKIDMPPGFYIQSRIDTLTDEGIKALKKAHINVLYLGIESASRKVLKMMHKNITINQVVAACEKLQNNKIRIGSYWIIGHPGDNPQEATYSLEMLNYLFNKELIQIAEPALFMPYPGTLFFQHPKKYDIEILTLDWRKWMNSFDLTNEPICQLKDFSAKEISLFYKKSLNIVHKYNRVDSYLRNFLNNRDNIVREQLH